MAQALKASKIDRYKLQTTFHEGYVIHTTYKTDLATGQRRVEVKTKWLEKRSLGSGGYGIISLEEAEAGQLRAVKKITRGLRGNSYSRELAALSRLKDYQDLFVLFFGWYESSDFIYIAMEYIEHGDLSKYLKTPFARPNAREITKQLLEGLAVLHEKRFCHRDLKPQNILVASPHPVWVKIADFGGSKNEKCSNLRTRHGTQGYIAPEVMGLLPSAGNSYTNAMDIWSLGCVVHELLTSQVPFLELASTLSMDSESWSLAPPGAESELESESAPRTDTAALFAFCLGKTEFPTEILQKSQANKYEIDFVKGLLVASPKSRLSAKEALGSPWMALRESAGHHIKLPSYNNDSRPPPHAQSIPISATHTKIGPVGMVSLPDGPPPPPAPSCPPPDTPDSEFGSPAMGPSSLEQGFIGLGLTGKKLREAREDGAGGTPIGFLGRHGHSEKGSDETGGLPPLVKKFSGGGRGLGKGERPGGAEEDDPIPTEYRPQRGEPPVPPRHGRKRESQRGEKRGWEREQQRNRDHPPLGTQHRDHYHPHPFLTPLPDGPPPPPAPSGPPPDTPGSEFGSPARANAGFTLAKKQPVNKSMIGEPKLISSTSSITTIDLPPQNPTHPPSPLGNYQPYYEADMHHDDNHPESGYQYASGRPAPVPEADYPSRHLVSYDDFVGGHPSSTVYSHDSISPVTRTYSRTSALGNYQPYYDDDDDMYHDDNRPESVYQYASAHDEHHDMGETSNRKNAYRVGGVVRRMKSAFGLEWTKK